MDPALGAPRPGDLGFLEGPRRPWVQRPWPVGPSGVGTGWGFPLSQGCVLQAEKVPSRSWGVSSPGGLRLAPQAWRRDLREGLPATDACWKTGCLPRGFHCGIRTGALTLGF